MAGDSTASLSDLASEAQLAAHFESLRPRLVAMLRRRISPKLSARIDPESIIQDAYLRAVRRWLSATEKPPIVDAWIFRQLLDQYCETTRAALGPTRDAARDVPWPDESVAELAHKLFDDGNRPSAALSHEECCLALQTALQKLDNTDREILALRYFDGLAFAEIATILDLTENTANQRAVRALLKLKRLIPRSLRPPGQSAS